MWADLLFLSHFNFLQLVMCQDAMGLAKPGLKAGVFWSFYVG
jgi:hypothetical protein